jgi:SAM-dependent methyltransferase
MKDHAMVADERRVMEGAYQEYRKACYRILWRHVSERGLLDVLAQPRSLDDVASAINVLPERRLGLELLLKAMIRFDAVSVVRDHDETRYQVSPGFDGESDTLDLDLIGRAIGRDNVDRLIHAASYRGIVDALIDSENRISSDFVAANLSLWDEFLQQPFYATGREAAVATIARPGARVLDIGCGIGLGLLELAAAVGPEGEVIGVERSHDFVIESEKRVGGIPGARVMRADADSGLGFLQEGYFDGAMLVGVYHFLKQQRRIFETVARLLRPGGRFVLGYVYLERGTYDQELMDLRMLFREPRATPTTAHEIARLGEGAGLRLTSDEHTLGCFGWFSLERVAA